MVGPREFISTLILDLNSGASSSFPPEMGTVNVSVFVRVVGWTYGHKSSTVNNRGVC